MNLTTEPWVPIIWSDSRPGNVSLREAFEHGEKIRDLAVCPHERIALMRLLICIVQAALDGPSDHDNWESCRPQIIPAALKYLEHWQEAFELFGSAPRFLQVDKLSRVGVKSGNNGAEGNSVSKLDLALATGNNTTLFDNAGGPQRTFRPVDLAVALMTFQCFSPGGRIGLALWDGEQTPGNGSSNHAPCLADGMLHALLRGDSLLSTLHLNLMTKEQVGRFFGEGSWGKPIWESMPQNLADAQAVTNATHTYLGRLVPLARAVWFLDDCQAAIIANGLEYASYDDGWREPSATVIVRNIKGQPERALLSASLDRAPWHELHALTVKSTGEGPGGPAALQNISEDTDAFDLWVGGLVSNKAKPIDTTESVFHVPVEMLKASSQRAYEGGVQLANTAEFRVKRAASVYHKELGDNLDRPEMKSRKRQIQGTASSDFWTEVEQSIPQLLAIAERPEKLGQPPKWQQTDWSKAVWSSARSAYDHACPHETPRQIRAYALGLKALFAQPATEDMKQTEGSKK